MKPPEARLAQEARIGRLVGIVVPVMPCRLVVVVAPWLYGCSQPAREVAAPRRSRRISARLLILKASCFEAVCLDHRRTCKGGSHRHGHESHRDSMLGWTCDPRTRARGPTPWEFRAAKARDSGTNCPSGDPAPTRRSCRDPMPRDPCPRSRPSLCAHHRTRSLSHRRAGCTSRTTPRTRARASAHPQSSTLAVRYQDCKRFNILSEC